MHRQRTDKAICLCFMEQHNVWLLFVDSFFSFLPFLRLLQSRNDGLENGSRSLGRTCENENTSRHRIDGQAWRYVDVGGVPLVYLLVHWHSPCRGKSESLMLFLAMWGLLLSLENVQLLILWLHTLKWPVNFFPLFAPQTVLRIWDCLFYEGSKIIFRVALTLIKQHQAFILEANNFPDICDTFKQITKGPFVTECHTFMQVRIFLKKLYICKPSWNAVV